MTLRRFLALTAFSLIAAPIIYSQTPNNLTALNGKYALNGHGDKYALLGIVEFAVTDVGYLVFDGAGNVTQGKLIEDISGSVSTLSETGTYSVNSDGSYVVNLHGTQTRTFNLVAMELDSTSGIAQDGDAIDSGTGDGSGDEIELQLTRTNFIPANGYQISDLAGTYSEKTEGTNAFGQQISEVGSYTIDQNGNIIGTGTESVSGSSQPDVITGKIAITPDGTITGNMIIGGQSEPITAQIADTSNIINDNSVNASVLQACTPQVPCADSSNNCATWVANGFGSSTFYTTAQKKQYCAKSLNLCSSSGSVSGTRPSATKPTSLNFK